ncbi:MAG: Arm DNA-binding domain-containing protein [Deltaproteobacteria bacterium]|nr:Arm DNA-binding domain-containing protein [Deltaproteobacteria bacterium]
MPLTDTFIKNLKPANKPIKHADMDGLYLYLASSGLKSWRFDYRFGGKRQTLTFGTYPMVSLKEAREKLLEAKKTIKSGVNPSIQKKAAKESKAACSLGSFEVVAREWFENNKIIIKDNYSSRIMGRLEKDLFPDTYVKTIPAP